MAIDSSKFFDSIRIKPNKLSAKAAGAARSEEAAMCEWAGCQNKGPHRAPKGRENSREYFHFCLDHVREYNQTYNFFQGMNADAVARYQKDALTGHRPTWKMGANTGGTKGASRRRGLSTAPPIPSACSPSSTAAAAGGPARSEAKAETRKVMNAERKALQVMGLAAGCHARGGQGASTRRWSSSTIPTPMAATARPRTA